LSWGRSEVKERGEMMTAWLRAARTLSGARPCPRSERGSKALPAGTNDEKEKKAKSRQKEKTGSLLKGTRQNGLSPDRTDQGVGSSDNYSKMKGTKYERDGNGSLNRGGQEKGDDQQSPLGKSKKGTRKLNR